MGTTERPSGGEQRPPAACGAAHPPLFPIPEETGVSCSDLEPQVPGLVCWESVLRILLPEREVAVTETLLREDELMSLKLFEAFENLLRNDIFGS